MKNKKIVLTFVASSFILASIFFSVLFVYDPLKIFHKPWKYKEYLQHNMRQQAVGIINHWEFDSIILGTSMLKNTSSKEASEKLGGKFVNISLSGASYFERAIPMNYVLKKKNIKKVLYSLDNGGLTRIIKESQDYKLSTWDYLYDDNPINDFKVYINHKYLKCLFSPFIKKKCMGSKYDFDRPIADYHIKKNAIRFGGLENWLNEKNHRALKNVFKLTKSWKQKFNNEDIQARILKSQKYIDETLIKYVFQYPQTEFICFIPPYPRMRSAIYAQKQISTFAIRKANIKYLVSKSKKYKNLKIYGWDNYPFVDNLKNYKDYMHYEYKINSWILDAIKKDEGHLTIYNIDNYLDQYTKKALNYNLYILGNKIEHYLYPGDKNKVNN